MEEPHFVVLPSHRLNGGSAEAWAPLSLGFIARGRGLESHLSGNDRPWSPWRGHSLFSEPLGRSFRCSLSSQERERPALAPAEHVRSGVLRVGCRHCVPTPLLTGSHSLRYIFRNWFSFLDTKSGVVEDGLKSICPTGRGT